MIDADIVRRFREEAESELRGNILPFWVMYGADERNGGFHGLIRSDLTVEEEAPKGVVLNARILWTFARAFRLFGEAQFLSLARRAYEYFTRAFFDADFGGVFWSVDWRAKPLDTRKKTYAQAFALYALAEYYSATTDTGAIDLGHALLGTVSAQCRDRRGGGYLETFERDWSLAADQRLSEVDLDEKKSMNTHLHMLEACAALVVAERDSPSRPLLRELLELFLDHIVDPSTHHFRMFFDEQWTPRSDRISFGHDVEGSWLLSEAAGVLGDEGLRERMTQACLAMAGAVRAEGLDKDGGLFYEAGPTGILDYDKHWWPQAEAVVGFLNALELTDDPAWFEAAWRCWKFISTHLVDRRLGEWHWKVSREGKPDPALPKVDRWKCPYHNTRACIEIMTRLDRLAGHNERICS